MGDHEIFPQNETSYTAPDVEKVSLDSGGNYASADSDGGIAPFGSSSIEGDGND